MQEERAAGAGRRRGMWKENKGGRNLKMKASLELVEGFKEQDVYQRFAS